MSVIFDAPFWISRQKNSRLNKFNKNNYFINQLEITFDEPRFERKNQPEELLISLTFSFSQFLHSAVNIHVDFILICLNDNTLYLLLL